MNFLKSIIKVLVSYLKYNPLSLVCESYKELPKKLVKEIDEEIRQALIMKKSDYDYALTGGDCLLRVIKLPNEVRLEYLKGDASTLILNTNFRYKVLSIDTRFLDKELQIPYTFSNKTVRYIVQNKTLAYIQGVRILEGHVMNHAIFRMPTNGKFYSIKRRKLVQVSENEVKLIDPNVFIGGVGKLAIIGLYEKKGAVK